MATETKYFVVDVSLYDKYGKLQTTAYQIRYRKSFLGIYSYWKYISYDDCGMSGCYKSRTTFKNIDEANTFISEILCKGKAYGTWKTTTVNNVTCK